jgi:hypothetical protein
VNCASPPLYNFDPNNQTILHDYTNCNAEIAEKFGPTIKFYGTYYAAVDYKTVVDMVNPDKVQHPNITDSHQYTLTSVHLSTRPGLSSFARPRWPSTR